MNIVKVILPSPVVSTNDTNLETGVGGIRWKDTNVDYEGNVNNPPSGAFLAYKDSIEPNSTETWISKIISLQIDGTLGSDTKPGYIKVPLSGLGFSLDADILGLNVIGVSDNSRVRNLYAMRSHLANGNLLESLNISIVDNNLIVRFYEKSQAGFAGKSINLMIYYR